MARGQNNRPDVRGVAAIDGTGRKRARPHLLVGQAVRTDNGGGQELPLELPHFTERCQFKVDNRHISAVGKDSLPQLIQIAGHVHNTEMVIERMCQHFRSFAVALSDNYTKRFHEIFPHWLWRKQRDCFRWICKLRGLSAGCWGIYFLTDCWARSVAGS
jgi:hypothetical protein